MVNPLLIVLVNFIIGTLCLVCGVKLMSGGLESLNSDVIKRALSRFTGKLLPAFAVGTAVTALVQSSTAVTVITVSLVNTGLMKLTQAVGIIYGANIGTTVTAQLMSFNVTDLSFPILLLGGCLFALGKKPCLRSAGKAIAGLGLVFLGLGLLNSGIPFLRESRFVYDAFRRYGSNPFIGVFIGMLTTAVIQSSTATVGFTIVLFNAGFISLEGALGLTLGDNIGTCLTAQLASLGTSISARRTAWSHTIYNVIGSIAALILIGPFSRLVVLVTGLLGQEPGRYVANAHTLFNVLSAGFFLPLTKYYVRFIEWLIPEPGPRLRVKKSRSPRKRPL